MRDKRRRRLSRRSRRGATMVEFAITIMVFLVLVVGMLDLSMAVFRSHIVSYAARQGARTAIVRGEYADKLGSLGPTTFTGPASDSHPVASAVGTRLVGVSPSDVDVTVEWIDGGNKVEQRVRVTVAATYTPMITLIFGSPTWMLQGSSTMPIAH